MLIPVNTAADIDLRLQYSPSTFVQLELRANLTTPIKLNSSFSCTSFYSQAGNVFSITTANVNGFGTALWIQGATDVKVSRINLRTAYGTTACVQPAVTFTAQSCAALFLGGSSNRVTIEQGVVDGALLHRFLSLTVAYHLGGIGITTISNTLFDRLNVFTSSPVSTGNCINIVGSGSTPTLTRSNITIQNSEISSCYTGILLRGAVGTRLHTQLTHRITRTLALTRVHRRLIWYNYIHDQDWAGVQCGLGVNNNGDCSLTFVAYNKFVRSGTNSDSSSLYSDNHWYVACTHTNTHTKVLHSYACDLSHVLQDWGG